MLLQFMVENYKSFHQETILNLAPVKSRIHPLHVLHSEERGPKVKALPLALFYGANASGKSNLIRAMDFARRLIVEGTRGNEPIDVAPFKLSADSLDKPSRFEFVIKHDSVLYTYGFATTRQEIKEEWLFSVFQRHEVRLFERINKDKKSHFEFGEKLATTKSEKQRLGFISQNTRPNQLFLSEAASEKVVEPLKPLLKWFRDNFVIIWPESSYLDLLTRAHKDNQFTSFLTEYLRLADTRIQSLEMKSTDLKSEQVLSVLPEKDRKEFLDFLEKAPDHEFSFKKGKTLYTIRQSEKEDISVLSLQTKHSRTDGKTVNFDLEDESDGTLRMMHLVPALYNLRTDESVYVVDELDRSLHPLQCRMFIDALLGEVEKNNCRGQMILTTHETSLLDLDLLRRDEIWFVEKDKEGASHITSLAEFKKQVRADLQIAKGYLNGRFGAIPFVGDIKRLL